MKRSEARPREIALHSAVAPAATSPGQAPDRSVRGGRPLAGESARGSTEDRSSVDPRAWGCVGAYWRGSKIHARFRSPLGELHEDVFPARHSFCIRAEDAAKALSGGRDVIGSLRASRAFLRAVPDGDWLRIEVDGRDALDAICQPNKWAARVGITTYEGDLHPVKRWLLEDRVKIGRPKRGYFDLEAYLPNGMGDFAHARLICWAIVDDNDEEIATGMLEEDHAESERRLLQSLLYEARGLDQLLAWNGDRFDFPFLEARAEVLGIGVEWRRWLRLDHMLLAQRMNVSASKSGEEKQSMALAAWAKHVLGEQKAVDLAEGTHVAWKMWQAGGTERLRLLGYCRDDAGKMARIEARTGFVELHQSICEVAGVLPDSRTIGPKQPVESFFMRLGHDRGMRFPSFFGYEGEERDANQKLFEGAFVLKPADADLGIQTNVHVCDFSRLYPSIAQSFNLSPETLLKHRNEVRPGEVPPPGVAVALGSGHWFRQEPRGLLPFVFDEMLRLRKVWDDRKTAAAPGTEEWNEADKRSTAYKNMTNAAFGVTGSRWSRLFRVECAESMTLGGATLIKRVIAEGESEGIRTIAGDTDSSFSAGATRPQFEAFVDRLNRDVFPAMLREAGARECKVKLAYEKAFEVVVFCAGKRYAGRYAHYKGSAPNEDSEPEVKGLEYKRGDASRLARAMQAEVLDLLLGGGVLEDPSRGLDAHGRPKKTARRAHCEARQEVFLELVTRWRSRILNRDLKLADIVISKRLSREPEQYRRPKRKDGSFGLYPQQARAAFLARERGKDVGAGVRVEYLIVDAREKEIMLAEDFDGTNVDRPHLWENLVYPPTQRVLEACFPMVKWEAYRRVRKHFGDTRQVRLFEY